MKLKKILVVVVVAVVIVLLVGASMWWMFFRGDKIGESAKVSDNNQQSAKLVGKGSYLLDGYPIDVVPLYKLDEISSAHFFVDKDPNKPSDYFGKTTNYHNIVFESDATADDVLKYYRSLMSEQNPDSPSDQMQGKIGKYKISVSHYGEDTRDVYLQVYLPEEEYKADNPFYATYYDQKTIEQSASLVEINNSYGKLNQKGGEVEYAKYFTVIDSGDQNKDDIDDVDEFLVLKTEYEKEYKEKSGYSYDEKTGLMKWQDGKSEITLMLARSHNRVYLMIREPLNK